MGATATVGQDNEQTTEAVPREADDLIDKVMSEATRVNRHEMKVQLGERGYRMNEAQFGLLVHRVRERLRDALRIEFVPDSSRGGWLVRANARQKIRRGQNFARAGLRKQMRAVEVLRGVNPADLSDGNRNILASTIEKTQHAATRAHHALVLEGREQRPTVCERPSDPRRSK